MYLDYIHHHSLHLCMGVRPSTHMGNLSVVTSPDIVTLLPSVAINCQQLLAKGGAVGALNPCWKFDWLDLVLSR